MSSYAKINFMDIEAQNDPAGEIRFSRKYLESKELGLTYRSFAPNHQSDSAHKHEIQEEVYVVISGSGRMLLDGKIEDLKKWDVVRVAPGTVRAFAAGLEGMEMIIAGGPKPEGGDGIKAKVTWPIG